MPYVISIAGQLSNGKSAMAVHLQQKLNEKTCLVWKKGSLGLAVKKIFAENFGVTLEFIEQWKNNLEPPPGFDCPIREGLTKIGDGWRSIRQDIWLYKLFNNNISNLVNDDCRYLNETMMMRSQKKPDYMSNYKGITVLIWRPGYENDNPNASERELTQFSRKLVNTPEGPINRDDIPFDLWLKNDSTEKAWLAKAEEIIIPYFMEKFNISPPRYKIDPEAIAKELEKRAEEVKEELARLNEAKKVSAETWNLRVY